MLAEEYRWGYLLAERGQQYQHQNEWEERRSRSNRSLCRIKGGIRFRDSIRHKCHRRRRIWRNDGAEPGRKYVRTKLARSVIFLLKLSEIAEENDYEYQNYRGVELACNSFSV